MYTQYLHDHVIELLDCAVPTTSQVHILKGILTVPKDENKVQPCLDCTRSHLNEHMTPWGMELPSIMEFVTCLKPGM